MSPTIYFNLLQAKKVAVYVSRANTTKTVDELMKALRVFSLCCYLYLFLLISYPFVGHNKSFIRTIAKTVFNEKDALVSGNIDFLDVVDYEWS